MNPPCRSSGQCWWICQSRRGQWTTMLIWTYGWHFLILLIYLMTIVDICWILLIFIDNCYGPFRFPSWRLGDPVRLNTSERMRRFQSIPFQLLRESCVQQLRQARDHQKMKWRRWQFISSSSVAHWSCPRGSQSHHLKSQL